MRTIISFVSTLALLASLGCSDDETATSTTTTSTSAAMGGAGGNGSGAGTQVGGAGGAAAGGNGSGGQLIGGGDPGELTIEVNDLAGVDGKTLIVSVLKGDTKEGGICVALSGDPASASEIAGTVGDNPCNVGDPVTLAGVYTLRGGLYMSGAPGPEQCLAQDVLVDGDTTVELGAFGPCQ